MTPPPRTPSDLVVLAADKEIEFTLRGLFSRPQSLGVRPFNATIFPHPGHDAGCRTQGAAFLRNFTRRFAHALLVFDLEGSGRDRLSAVQLEQEVDDELAASGWGDRAATLVLDPELEIWIWSDSPEVDRICGWSGRIPSLRQWLHEEGLLTDLHGKPKRPKEAFRLALKHVRKQVSPALFRQMAETVSVRRCTDRAFNRLILKLKTWFPSA